MAYLDKRVSKEIELRHYWALMSEGWARFLHNPLDPELDNLADDMDLLREQTDWPLLRAMCTRALIADARIRQPLVVVAISELKAL